MVEGARLDRHHAHVRRGDPGREDVRRHSLQDVEAAAVARIPGHRAKCRLQTSIAEVDRVDRLHPGDQQRLGELLQAAVRRERPVVERDRGPRRQRGRLPEQVRALDGCLPPSRAVVEHDHAGEAETYAKQLAE